MTFRRMAFVCLSASQVLLAGMASAHGPAQASVSVYFVPGEDCTAQIVAAIDAAKRQIRVQAYGFSSPPILSALVRAKQRGVDVEVVLDKSNDRRSAEAHYSGATYVANAGIPVWIDKRSGIAHNKVFVVDEFLSMNGSLNATIAAQMRNVENVAFMESHEVAAWFLANWESRRAASYRFEPPGVQ